MIAAIYARKSTEQAGRAEQDKSVARQIAESRAFAQKQGWVVAEQHVYCDDGISGAEYENRPGLQAMLAALKPRAPFQVLVMSEDSRLSREQSDNASILKLLLRAGVRIFTCDDGQEIVINNPTDKLLRNVKGFTAEVERAKTGTRVHSAFVHKVRAGHVVGGRLYGYRNVDVLGEPDRDGRRKRLHVERQINEEEADRKSVV